MKPCTYLLNPDGRRCLPVEARIHDTELLKALLGAGTQERLDVTTLRQIDAANDLVLVQRSDYQSLNAADAYQVSGQRVNGKALICSRPNGAGDLPSYLPGNPEIGYAPIAPGAVSKLVQWEAPVAGEVAGRILDVAMLDEYSKHFCDIAGAATFGAGVVRICGVDQAGHDAVAFNVPAGDWKLFRRACLDLFDRRWSVVHEWAVREMPAVRGANDETPVALELAEVKAKAGGHSIECYGADANAAYVVFHLDPISGTKLAKRTHRMVAVPGLPLYVGDSGVPILAHYQVVGA